MFKIFIEFWKCLLYKYIVTIFTNYWKFRPIWKNNKLMADVVKRLRPRIVVPLCVGSNPIIRPIKKTVTLVTVFFIMQNYEVLKNPYQSQDWSLGSSASELRLECFCVWTKSKKQNTELPLNANEQDNPIIRPILRPLKRSFLMFTNGMRTLSGWECYNVT